MKNRHDGMIKGFTQLSRAWYGKYTLNSADYTDSITFGFYSPEGGATGEMTVEWICLDGKIIPEISIFNDAWSALSQVHDLIDLLGRHDGEDSTPEQFCEFLKECGFVDMTETDRNRE